jgi:hypothetical protein
MNINQSHILLKKYLNQYKFHIYDFNEIKNLPNFEYDNSNNTLSIYDIVIKLYKPCFKSNYNNNIIYNSLFVNNYKENYIYFLTDGKKIIIYGFLWKNNNSYTIETVCKNKILNYEKLCFRLLFNLIIKFRKKFLNKTILLEVDKNNNSAIECYRQLGFSGRIINGVETQRYSNRGFLILELKFGSINRKSAALLESNKYKEIKIDNKIILIKPFKDSNGIVKYFYNVKNDL